jgi:CHRD domain
MRIALTALLATVLAASAAAQTSYYADLDGTQETPPTGSAAGGWAHVTLNPGNTVTYEVRTWGITATAAHIHIAPVGVPGSIIVTLTGGPTVWTGTSAALTAAQLTALQTLGLYVNVHSAAFPAGEIRGQLEGRPRRFGAFLNAKQEVPVNASTATGTASFDMNIATTDLTYSETWNGVGGTASHIHNGPVGVSGGIDITLLGGPVTWAGTALATGSSTWTDLQTLADYANIHSASKPGGEIRGQIVSSGIKYGDVAGMPMDFEVTGPPVSGGTINLAISGGNPGGLGMIMVALGPGAALVKGLPFLLNPGMIIVTGVFVPLSGTGSITFPSTLPDVGGNFDVYLQCFCTTGGPLKASNGVRLPLVDLPF